MGHFYLLCYDSGPQTGGSSPHNGGSGPHNGGSVHSVKNVLPTNEPPRIAPPIAPPHRGTEQGALKPLPSPATKPRAYSNLPGFPPATVRLCYTSPPSLPPTPSTFPPSHTLPPTSASYQIAWYVHISFRMMQL